MAASPLFSASSVSLSRFTAGDAAICASLGGGGSEAACCACAIGGTVSADAAASADIFNMVCIRSSPTPAPDDDGTIGFRKKLGNSLLSLTFAGREAAKRKGPALRVKHRALTSVVRK